MIDTATIEHAREMAHDAVDELSGRIKDSDVVPKLRKQAKKMKKQAKKMKKEAMKAGPSKSRRRPPVPFLLLVAAAIGFSVWFVRRRQQTSTRDIAPDPFGAAVEKERAAFGQRPNIATPGA
jgi:hypothetical protein